GKGEDMRSACRYSLELLFCPMAKFQSCRGSRSENAKRPNVSGRSDSTGMTWKLSLRHWMNKTLDEFGDLEITVNGEVRCSDPGGFAELGNQLPERLESVVMEAAAGEAMVRVELGQGAKIEVIEPGLAARGAQARIKEICAPRVVRRGWRI